MTSGGAVLARDVYCNLGSTIFKPDAFSRETDLDPVALEDLQYRVTDLRILPTNQARAHLDDGDLRAESSKHLRELQSDIASTDDDQVGRQRIQFHHAGAGHERISHQEITFFN